MKAVLDSNVIVSGLHFGGTPARVLELANSQAYQLCLSSFILQEVAQTLRRKFAWSDEDIQRAEANLRRYAHVIDPRPVQTLVTRKDSDNRILECAVKAHADYLVTGDKRDLLPLKHIGSTKIISPAEFLAIVEAKQ